MPFVRSFAHWTLRLIAAICSFFCITIGGCTTYYQLGQFEHIELRVWENNDAADKVTKLGEFVEAYFLKHGRIPSLKEFNCPTPCPSEVYIITHEAWLGKDGVVYAKYLQPGLSFTPLSQFRIHWNSKTRKTDRELYKNRWVWMLAPIPWITFGVLLIALPFLTFAGIKIYRNRVLH